MPPTLDQIFANDGARGSLRLYMRRTHTIENYNFIAEEAAYRQHHDVATARALVDEYVRAGAPQQVNLPAAQRDAIVDAVDAPGFHAGGNEFAAARGEIRGLINDLIPDFVQHEGRPFANLGGGGAPAPAPAAGAAPIADDPLADIDDPADAAEHAAGDGPGVEPAQPEAPAAHHADAPPPAPEPAPARDNPRDRDRERERERPDEMGLR